MKKDTCFFHNCVTGMCSVTSWLPQGLLKERGERTLKLEKAKAFVVKFQPGSYESLIYFFDSR